MSSFRVIPLSVMQSGAQLSPIAGQVLEMHGTIAGASGAADGTPGAEAFEDLLGHWAAVLPQFAASSASLAAGLTGSGMGYALVDDVVGSDFDADAS